MSLETKYRERLVIQRRIKEHEAELKKLRMDMKVYTENIRQCMERDGIDKYQDIVLSDLQPKPKKKPLTKKKKRNALVEHFTSMQLNNPKEIVDVILRVQENARYM